MNSLTFDTHRVVKRLTEAGFSPTQAETVTDVLQETRASDLSELATKGDLRTVEAALKDDLRTVEATLKGDLRTVEAALKGDLRSVEAALKGDISALRSELRTVDANTAAKIADNGRMILQWVLGLFVAEIAVIAGLIKLLAGH